MGAHPPSSDLPEERLRPRFEGDAVPRPVHEALEARSFSDAFHLRLLHLAEPRWADVSLALIEGAEVPSARVRAFERPAPTTYQAVTSRAFQRLPR